MRFIIMHKTNAHWEAGAIPTPALLARVGGLLGQLAKAGVLLAGEGLRASSEGVRLKFSAGTRSVSNGPFETGNELPAAFSILRAGSLDEAIEWASRQAKVLGDGEVDIRPVTEPWDIGIGFQTRAHRDQAIHGAAKGHCRDGSRSGAVGGTAGRAVAARRGDHDCERASRHRDHAPQRQGQALQELAERRQRARRPVH